MMRPVFRFAPSPNGELHLGHAYSALLNARMAKREDGLLLLRIEDVDTQRCSRTLEEGIRRDLSWLGIVWEEPVRRQSEHFDDHAAALEALAGAGLAYPSFLSRGEVQAMMEAAQGDGREWPRDPDGVPLFPTVERRLADSERRRRIAEGEPHAWRLDVEAAVRHVGKPLFWEEEGAGPGGEGGRIEARPQDWGDVVIARKGMPASYQLAVTVDDALQGVTHVVRGRDLFFATAVQRLLQELLGLPQPVYRHHGLILGEDGRKLSKSRGDTSLSSLRAAGLTPHDIRRMVGL